MKPLRAKIVGGGSGGGISIKGDKVDKGFLRYDEESNKYETILPDSEVNQESTNIVENQAITNYVRENVGYSLGLNIDTTNYVLTVNLKNATGQVLDSKQVDLPIESMIINASYSNGILTITLQSGQTIDIDLTDLVSGYVTIEDFNTAMGGKVDKTTKINNKELSEDIELTSSDVGAYSTGETDANFVSKSTKVNDKPLSSNITLTYRDVGAMPNNEAVGKSLSASGKNVSLKDQNGNVLSIIETQDTTYSNATTQNAGLMSATDKSNLDSLVRNDNGYINKNVNDLTNYTTTSALNNLLNQKQDKNDNNLETLSKNVVQAVNEVNSLAKGSNKSLSYSNYQSFVTIFNSLSKDDYNRGQNIYILTTDVPDLWIYNKSDNYSSYTYTTDSAIINELRQNGYFQVGYYLIGMLETDKVDLTGYVQKTTTIAGVDLQDNISASELRAGLTDSDNQFVTSQQKQDWVNRSELSEYQTIANKSESINSNSTINTYPSSSAVYNFVNGKRLILSNQYVSNFITYSPYQDFPYSANISVPGITQNDIAFIIFSASDVLSGNFAPICETGTDIITIYSKIDVGSVTIPTIVIIKESQETTPVAQDYGFEATMNTDAYTFYMYLKDLSNNTREIIYPTETYFNSGKKIYHLQENNIGYIYEYEVKDNTSLNTLDTNTFTVTSAMIGTNSAYYYPTTRIECTIRVTNAQNASVNVNYNTGSMPPGIQCESIDSGIDTNGYKYFTFYLEEGDFFYSAEEQGYIPIYYESFSITNADIQTGSKEIIITLQQGQPYEPMYYFTIQTNPDLYSVQMYLVDISTTPETRTLINPANTYQNVLDYELPLNESNEHYEYEIYDTNQTLVYSNSIIASQEGGDTFIYPNQYTQTEIEYPYYVDESSGNPETYVYPNIKIYYNNNGVKGAEIYGGYGSVDMINHTASQVYSLQEGTYFYDISVPGYQSISNGTFTITSTDINNGYVKKTISMTPEV